MTSSILVLVILLAIIITTGILIVREITKVKSNLVVEQELSRLNEDVLSTNMDITNSSMKKRMETSSNNAWRELKKLSGKDVTIEEQINEVSAYAHSLPGMFTEQIAASNQQLGEQIFGGLTSMFSIVAKVMEAGAKKVVEQGPNDTLLFKANGYKMFPPGESSGDVYGSLTFDPVKGISMSNTTGQASVDVTAGIISVGKSLNVAGSLNFANNNSSYMLGVDGTSMYLNTPELKIRDVVPSGLATTITSKGITTNNFSLSNSGDFGVDGQNIYIKPSQPNGGFVVKDSANNVRLTVQGSNISVTGDVRSAGSICIDNACIAAKDLQNLQILSKRMDSGNMILG